MELPKEIIIQIMKIIDLPKEIIMQILNYCDRSTKIKIYKICATHIDIDIEKCCQKEYNDDPDDYYFFYYCSTCQLPCCPDCFEHNDLYYDHCVICQINDTCTDCQDLFYDPETDRDSIVCKSCLMSSNIFIQNKIKKLYKENLTNKFYELFLKTKIYEK